MSVACLARNAVIEAVLDSLSFAEKSLGVRKIYVIGHMRCGAVALAAQDKAPPSLVPQLEAAPRRASYDVRRAGLEVVCISCGKLRALGAEV
ncbi:Carbonic anhydrase [Pyrobaculum oguniense TE7]|uniref:Carbonic anhydrase n=1 Tax=Pyrobaculum oguniense (strain DSM 13380 / JCM 10595 / TE7) TaxID=698757 RepID=H6QBG5_PYROT|nr:Carbonic anhydrase [Pyrobaculum oguniense TE7]